jgi:hypothetical protein
MVWLKACPRCKGDLFLDEDHYGKYKSCIQCGYIKDLTDVPIAMPSGWNWRQQRPGRTRRRKRTSGKCTPLCRGGIETRPYILGKNT